jgi:hypothetical protein
LKGILFRVNGGFGKNIMATAVCRAIKRAHPDIPLHVQASYPDAFVGLDEVEKVYPQVPSPDFYDLHRDFEILDAEPYAAHDYRRGGEHLVNVWCRRLGIKPKAWTKAECEDLKHSTVGTIRLARHEKRAAEQILGVIRQQAAGRTVVAVQWIGGTSTYAPGEAQNPNRVSQVRELPQEVAQALVDALAADGHFPLVIGLPTEPRLQNCLTLLDGHEQAFPLRVVLAVLALVDGLVSVDSFAPHAWAALGRSHAVVLWGATRPDNLGYESNTNIKPPANCCPMPGCNRPETHLGDWIGNGTVWTCPHDAACMAYNAKEIAKRVARALGQSEAPSCPSNACAKPAKQEPPAEDALDELKEEVA